MAPASISVTNGACFQTKVMTMPRQSRRLCVCKGSSRPDAEGMVQQPVLGEERAHALRRDDERNEQRPAIEPAQDRTRAGVSPSVR